jgi:hypothetical protein
MSGPSPMRPEASSSPIILKKLARKPGSLRGLPRELAHRVIVVGPPAWVSAASMIAFSGAATGIDTVIPALLVTNLMDDPS